MIKSLTRTALGGVVLVMLALAATSAKPMVGTAVSDAGNGSTDGGTGNWHSYHHRVAPAWPEVRPQSDGGPDAPRSPAAPSGYPGPLSSPIPLPGWPAPIGVPSGAPTGIPHGDMPGNGPPSGRLPDDDAPPADPPGADPADAEPLPGSGGRPTGTPSRDPVAAGPGTPTLGLGDPVDDPLPNPGATRPDKPSQALDRDARASEGYRRSLIYSGLLGLILAIIGLTIVVRHRRRW